MKILRKLFIAICSLSIIYIISNSIIKNLITIHDVNKLKSGMVLDEEKSSSTRKYYTKDGNLDYPSYTEAGTYTYPGSYVDLIISLDSALEVPLLYEITSYIIGGHACISGISYKDKYIDINSQKVIETALNESTDSAEVESKGYWLSRDHYYVLRVLCTEEEALIAFNEAVSYIDDPYNILFVVGTEENHYCSDLVSKAFLKAGINLNLDGGVTTMFDLLTSSNTMLVGYKETIDNVAYHYFLT